MSNIISTYVSNTLHLIFLIHALNGYPAVIKLIRWWRLDIKVASSSPPTWQSSGGGGSRAVDDAYCCFINRVGMTVDQVEVGLYF